MWGLSSRAQWRPMTVRRALAIAPALALPAAWLQQRRCRCGLGRLLLCRGAAWYDTFYPVHKPTCGPCLPSCTKAIDATYQRLLKLYSTDVIRALGAACVRLLDSECAGCCSLAQA